MPRFTKRQVITALSILYLLALTVVAACALYLNNEYDLPVPNILTALTVALPPLAGIALESFATFQSRALARRQHDGSSMSVTPQTTPAFLALSAAFLVFEVVLATLAGTYLAPANGLLCPLKTRWQGMFKAHDATHIRRIQDAFECCGFESVKDMAYPFPDREHGADTCAVAYGRNRRCLESWRGLEMRVAIMLLVVPIGVFGWKLMIFVAPANVRPWLPSDIRLPFDGNERANGPASTSSQVRQAITFQDSDDNDSTRDEVNHLNHDSNLASRIESGRVHASPLIQEPQNSWDDT